jgi:hypothetical protein
MSSIYTGKRETYEEAFTFNVSFFKTNIVEKIVTIDGTPGLFSQNVMVTKDYDQIFEEKIKPYYLPNDDLNDVIDKDLCKLNFKHEINFTSMNPYKYINKVQLVIDSISFQTYNYYIDEDYDRQDESYKQLIALLPLKININNKEIIFNASDSIDDFKMTEYGVFDGKTRNTGEETPPREFKGALFTQTYNKIFELSSVPESFHISLNINDNMFTNYYKNKYYRDYPEVLTNGEVLTVNKMFFYNSFISSFRLDGRVIQYIDYATSETSLLTKPSRVIREDLNIQTLSSLLKNVLKPEEKEQDKDLLNLPSPEESQQIFQQMLDKNIITPYTIEEYINRASKNI